MEHSRQLVDAISLAETIDAPGAADSARIVGPETGGIVVSGSSSVHDLTLHGIVTLAGDFTAGTLSVAPPEKNLFPAALLTTNIVALAGTFVAGSVSIGSLDDVLHNPPLLKEGIVEIGAGAALSAASVAMSAGAMNINGGSLSVDGTFSLALPFLSPFPRRGCEIC